MDRIQRLLTGMGGLGQQQQGPAVDHPTHDTSEQIHISSLALLKMLKHGLLLQLAFMADVFSFQAAPVFPWKSWA
jgi:hypothetical protein